MLAYMPTFCCIMPAYMLACMLALCNHLASLMLPYMLACMASIVLACTPSIYASIYSEKKGFDSYITKARVCFKTGFFETYPALLTCTFYSI